MVAQRRGEQVIWKKTPLGTQELKARALALDPVARNLLMLIDGTKTQEMFLQYAVGVRIEHFRALFSSKLIEPAGAMIEPLSSVDTAPVPASGLSPADRAFAVRLTRLISKQLGFEGLGMSERTTRCQAGQELQEIAERVVNLIRQRHGDAAGDQAAWQLFGPE